MDYTGKGIVNLTGVASVTPSHYSYQATGGPSIDGISEQSFVYNDAKTCTTKQFPCKIKYPISYKKCVTTGFFKPQATRLVPSTLTAKGAYVAASAICDQYPFLPPESMTGTAGTSRGPKQKRNHHYYHNGIGGCEIAGSIAINFYNSISTSGGVILGGTLPNQVYNITGSGGILIAGTVVIGGTIYNETGNAGVLIAGSAGVGRIYLNTGSAGVLIAGTASNSVDTGMTYTQLIDTFTTGGVSDPADNGR